MVAARPGPGLKPVSAAGLNEGEAHMILCITPNAAVDRTLTIPGFQKGGVSRTTDTFIAAGGKGMNVARAIVTLGGTALCAGFLGGHSGRLLAELAQHEGFQAVWTWIDQETRACIIIIDPEDEGEATLINEKGATITAADWARFQADILGETERVNAVCLCGSLPSGTPPAGLANLIRAVQAAGRPMWIDTSGAALQTAVSAAPAGVKVNAAEAGELAGQVVTDRGMALQVALALQQMGPQTVVLTLGKQGAVMVHEAGNWWAQPPVIQAVSGIGSGDAFLAGLVTGLAAGQPPDRALQRAVAAGAANALRPGGGRLDLNDFNTLLATVSVVAL
jgi:1-phosphofructokinase family hexose kinase